jgi:drug/metabolite transporter (DMT)-like permease
VHAALVGVSALFGLGYVAMKVILAHLPPGVWAATRATGALAVLLVLAAPRLLAEPPTWRQIRAFAAPALFGIFVNQVLFIEGLARTTPSHSAVINTGIPVFTLLIAWRLGRERMSRARAAGIALAVAGVLFLLEVDRLHLARDHAAGDLLTLGNAISFSFFLAAFRDLLRATPALRSTLFLYVWGTAGILACFAWQVDLAAFGALPPVVWAAIVFAILGVSITTYFLNNWALARVDASVVAVYVALQPIFAAFFSKIFLGISPSPRLAAAATATIAGVLLATRPPPGPAGRFSRTGVPSRGMK